MPITKHNDAKLNRGSGLTTARIENLSDGVFSIAMTLLVLNFRVPQMGAAKLSETMISLWPNLASYFLSFIALGTFWIGHHNQFHWIRHSDRRFLWINITFLASIVLIPFSTTVLGTYRGQQLAVMIYGVNLLTCALLLVYHWHYATHGHRLISASLSHAIIQRIAKRIRVLALLYLVALLCSFVVVWMSVILVLITQAVAIIPSRTDELFIRD